MELQTDREARRGTVNLVVTIRDDRPQRLLSFVGAELQHTDLYTMALVLEAAKRLLYISQGRDLAGLLTAGAVTGSLDIDGTAIPVTAPADKPVVLQMGSDTCLAGSQP